PPTCWPTSPEPARMHPSHRPPPRGTLPMRRTIVSVILFNLICANSVNAGVYLPAEQPDLVPTENGQGQPMPFGQFHDLVYPEVRALGLPLPKDPNGSPRTQQYRERRDALIKKGLSNLSADELISLSGYQIRLRELPAAEATLAPAKQRFKDRFEVYANLAVIQFQTGRLDEALSNQFLALDLMRSPRSPPTRPRAWLLKAERKQRGLFRLRRADPLAAGGARPVTQPAPLSPAPPGDRGEAIALVQQLLLWLPDDSRL